MTTKEFNLSERIKITSTLDDMENISIKDVKEAIRLIKLNPEKIDEIVGEKLI
jgi:hypothetical protein